MSTLKQIKLRYHRVLFYIVKYILPDIDVVILSIHPGILRKYDLSSARVVELTNGFIPKLSEIEVNPNNDEPARFVYLGTANKKRGVDAVLRTIATTLPNCSIDIVGPADDVVTDVAEEFDSISLHGRQSYWDAISLASQADIGLCVIDTSVENYRYSYFIKLFEYAALGRAVIASDTPAIRTVLEPKESIRLVDYDSPEALKRAARELATDESLRQSVGRRAQSDIQQYAWPTILDEYEEAVKQTIKKT